MLRNLVRRLHIINSHWSFYIFLHLALTLYILSISRFVVTYSTIIFLPLASFPSIWTANVKTSCSRNLCPIYFMFFFLLFIMSSIIVSLLTSLRCNSYILVRIGPRNLYVYLSKASSLLSLSALIVHDAKFNARNQSVLPIINLSSNLISPLYKYGVRL